MIDMIIAFCGTPGSGKTYDAVRKILDNLKVGGRVVYTNIRGIDDDICRQAIKDYCSLSDSQLQARLKIIPDDKVSTFFEFVERGSLIVLDEVQNHFGSRDWNSDKNKAFGKWASTHRHFGFDVVLITQHIERLDVSVRHLVEWLYVYRKINFFGVLVGNKYVCYSWLGSESHGKPLSKSIRSYDRSVFLCYQSYVAKDIKEVGIMRHANVLRHPVFISIPVIVLITGYMFLKKSSFSDGDLFGSKKSLQYAESLKGRKSPVKSSIVKDKPLAASSFPVVNHDLSPDVPESSVMDTVVSGSVSGSASSSDFPWLGIDTYVVDGVSSIIFDDDSCAPSVRHRGSTFDLSRVFPDSEFDCTHGSIFVLREGNIIARFFSGKGVSDG